jgi:UDP-3-O-[3-hydroxymyristoyl] glucosamine N-acyltransferase
MNNALVAGQGPFTLQQLADYLGATLVGEPSTLINGLSTLSAATSGDVSFLANPKYQSQLSSTQASAVIVHTDMKDQLSVSGLLMSSPYEGYARLSHLFAPTPRYEGGIHPSAVVADTATIDATAYIAANAVIENNAVIGAGVVIGPGSVVGHNSTIAKQTRLAANVSVYHNVMVGERCIIHSGVVLGADGFGFAPVKNGWFKIAQIGGVEIGNDVEIGANTTIDRGALEPTRIGNGVKLDNQIQIAHNVQIGDGSAAAACVGIAGSSTLGKGVTLSGGVGVAGHLDIADGVHISGMSLVSKSIKEKGSYSSGTALAPSKEWRKSAVRFRQLDDMAKRLKIMEEQLKARE